jgi:hypothetical protein
MNIIRTYVVNTSDTFIDVWWVNHQNVSRARCNSSYLDYENAMCKCALTQMQQLKMQSALDQPPVPVMESQAEINTFNL